MKKTNTLSSDAEIAWHVCMLAENIDRIMGQHHITFQELHDAVDYLSEFRQEYPNAPVPMPKFETSYARAGTPVCRLSDKES